MLEKVPFSKNLDYIETNQLIVHSKLNSKLKCNSGELTGFYDTGFCRRNFLRDHGFKFKPLVEERGLLPISKIYALQNISYILNL